MAQHNTLPRSNCQKSTSLTTAHPYHPIHSERYCLSRTAFSYKNLLSCRWLFWQDTCYQPGVDAYETSDDSQTESQWEIQQKWKQVDPIRQPAEFTQTTILNISTYIIQSVTQFRDNTTFSILLIHWCEINIPNITQHGRRKMCGFEGAQRTLRAERGNFW